MNEELRGVLEIILTEKSLSNSSELLSIYAVETPFSPMSFCTFYLLKPPNIVQWS